MADLVWPITLPQSALLDGTTEQPAANTVRFQPDAGPAQVRRRFSVRTSTIPYSLQLTLEEYEYFLAFFCDTEDGALAFDWAHPITGDTTTFRFAAPPTYTMMTPRTGPGQRVLVQFTLETLPSQAAPLVLPSGRIYAADLTAQRPPTPEDLEDIELQQRVYVEASGTNWTEPGAGGSSPDGHGDPDVYGMGSGTGMSPGGSLGGGGPFCRGCGA